VNAEMTGEIPPTDGGRSSGHRVALRRFRL
jgi:hypothetical protein